jgi:hypothetical protein
MSLLKEIFKPKTKGDAITLVIIFIAVGGFVVFEGMAFMMVANNPMGVGDWHDTEQVPNSFYLILSSSDVLTNVLEASGDTIFMFVLKHLETQHIKIELDAVQCIINRIVFTSGHLEDLYGSDRFYIDESEILDLADGTIELDLRNMNYPEDYDILFVRVTDMGSSGVRLLHRVILLE